MKPKIALYKPGQLVRHKRYGYQGVVVVVDPECQASEDWYQSNRTQPDRDQAWYHVLVSNSDQITYPAQSSLVPDEACQEVRHPMLSYFFERFENGRYIRNDQPWPQQNEDR